MTEQQPQINLELEVMWCTRHLEPFRANWPGGYGVALLELFSRAVEMPAIVEVAHADANQLPAALERFKPICCFVSADDLADVYAKAGV